jgi:hypothetical protein
MFCHLFDIYYAIFVCFGIYTWLWIDLVEVELEVKQFGGGMKDIRFRT